LGLKDRHGVPFRPARSASFGQPVLEQLAPLDDRTGGGCGKSG
jgi:hypothetical protein